MFPMLYSASFSLSHTQSFLSSTLLPLYCYPPAVHTLVTTAILFSISVHLLLVLLQSLDCFIFQILHINDILHYLSFSVYFTYHNVLQVHPCCYKWQNFAFSWLRSIPLYVQTTSSPSIHLLMDTVCSHIFSIINNASMNIRAHAYF